MAGKVGSALGIAESRGLRLPVRLAPESWEEAADDTGDMKA